ncbi:MAG: S41 family peptidase [Candidatus Omnitrophica bacterium]|nr:S41 family peptidase [Candidatus Omnitrophota bacterium]
MRRKLIIGAVVIAGVFIFISQAMSAMDKKKQDELFRKIQLFSDTLAIIQSDYVDEVNPKDLIYGALKGMLSSLDPHSQFMDPDTYNELKIDTEGKFGGLGIEITVKDGLLTVVTPIEDTPAWKAGVKANDRIVKINNELTRDMTLIDAVKKLRGKPGEPVTISILRESEKKIIELKIVREIIKIKDIKDARVLDDGVGYVRIIEFRENTPNDLKMVMEMLKKQGMNSIIIDLRNNPGGLLDSAVKVTEEFIDSGKLIVSTKGRKTSQNLEFYSHAGHPITDLPMAVLINEGSASGSEIFAGALQDYKRAIILGVKSFGKGSVQTVIPLSDGSALRLTTSKYFTPAGRVIHGKGVIPDIVIEDGKIETEATKTEESDIEKNKTKIFEEIENKEKKTPEEKEKEKEKDFKADNQLMRAVDILKAIKIYKNAPKP